MSQDQILCVSYFDQVIGPSTLYSSEPLSELSDIPDINRILEFNDEEGTFIFAYRKFQTVNHIFYMDSDIARGGKDLIMITYMIQTAIFKDEIVDVFKYLESKAPVLEDFASKIKDINEISSILHLKKSAISNLYALELADQELRNKFLGLFNKFFEKLSPNYKLVAPIKEKRSLKKIFILGAPKVGKKTLLKNIELIQFLNVKKNDLSTRLYSIIIENMEVLNYDIAMRDFECKEFENLENCVKISQSYILMFNLSDMNSLIQTKEIFNLVDNTRSELKTELTPLLIIGNKFDDKEDIEPDFVYKTFEIEELRELGVQIKYFRINILKEDEKVMEALKWLIKKII